jgi:hypothetical protein
MLSPIYKIDIRGGMWTVTYTEAQGSLVFQFELGSDKEILFFPSREKWQRIAPDWARLHHAEVLARVINEFGTRGCQVIEEL